MNPDEWLANFEAKVADVQQKAAAFKHNLESSGATETSPDGALRVTVAPNGALTGLIIHDAALRGGSGSELAAQIMNLARQAQRAAAGKVAAAFAPLSGTEPEPPQPVSTGPEAPVRAARPRSGRPVDDEDFSEEQIFSRDDDA